MTAAASPPPGAQQERTRFAWRRTVLTGTVVALLALRQGLLAPSPVVRGLAVAVVMLLWLTMLVAGHRRITALDRRRWPPGHPDAARLPGTQPLVIAAVTCGIALAGIAVTAVS